MSKSEVCQQKLQQYVVLPLDATSFVEWWKALPEDKDVDVKFPHEQHGLSRKTSNRAKTGVLEDFLKFVDNNSTPNGRAEGSHCPTYYFLPKFRRIDPPKKGEKNAEEKAGVSVACEFNRAQQSIGKDTISSFTVRQWLKIYRPKVAIHPQRTDYCDTCKRLEMEISRSQQVIKRLRQSGSANADQIQQLEEEAQCAKTELTEHKKDATKAQDFHRDTIKKCRNDWHVINELESMESRDEEQEAELTVKKNLFTLVLSADYQQAKLIPYWGFSAQPASTYYYQKVSHDVFGIIDHRDDQRHIVLFDERIGPKNTDHTVSYLEKKISEATVQHPWIRRVLVFLDNASSTNKNRYLFSWGMEMVDQRKIDYIRFCFMVAGHTKFAPDRLFAQVANSYNREDVFTITELANVCTLHATTSIDDGVDVLQWREATSLKYSDLPGTRKLHDFLIARSHVGSVVMKVREKCYTGPFAESPLRVTDPTVSAIPHDNYKETHSRPLSQEKLKDMVTMYDRFIPVERRPDYLAPFSPTSSGVGGPTSSSDVTGGICTEPPKRPRKKSQCQTPGCDGTGHKNTSRWHEGHTTKAGCPKSVNSD